jgi:hypothetical protein
MPAKVEFGKRSGGFCPCGRILFRGSTVALYVARLLDG